MRFFCDNKNVFELKVYISFVGNYTIEGRWGTSTDFAVLEPTYLTFKHDRLNCYIPYNQMLIMKLIIQPLPEVVKFCKLTEHQLSHLN